MVIVGIISLIVGVGIGVCMTFDWGAYYEYKLKSEEMRLKYFMEESK